MPAVAARLHQLEVMGRLKKHVAASRTNGGAAKNKGKYVNDEKKLHPMLIATWSLNGKSVTVKESKERKSKKGYAGYREEEKIVFQEVLYALTASSCASASSARTASPSARPRIALVGKTQERRRER